MSPDQQIEILRKEFEALKSEFYANNFPSSQDFNKYVRFNGRLKIPRASTVPTTCEVGELVEVSGKAYICSAANTFSLIGTQT